MGRSERERGRESSERKERERESSEPAESKPAAPLMIPRLSECSKPRHKAPIERREREREREGERERESGREWRDGGQVTRDHIELSLAPKGFPKAKTFWPTATKSRRLKP